MPEQRSKIIVSKQGRLGRIDPFLNQATRFEQRVEKFDTGETAWISFDQLQLLRDDNYYLLSESNIEQCKTRGIRAYGDQIEQDRQTSTSSKSPSF